MKLVDRILNWRSQLEEYAKEYPSLMKIEPQWTSSARKAFEEPKDYFESIGLSGGGYGIARMLKLLDEQLNRICNHNFESICKPYGGGPL